jgi:hypothetical protein
MSRQIHDEAVHATRGSSIPPGNRPVVLSRTNSVNCLIGYAPLDQISVRPNETVGVRVRRTRVPDLRQIRDSACLRSVPLQCLPVIWSKASRISILRKAAGEGVNSNGRMAARNREANDQVGFSHAESTGRDRSLRRRRN